MTLISFNKSMTYHKNPVNITVTYNLHIVGYHLPKRKSSYTGA